MSTNLEFLTWPIEFGCSLLIEKIIIPNFYTVKLVIEPIENNKSDMNLGIKKIRFFVDQSLQNSIFIYEDHPLVSTLNELETNLVTFPNEPYDYYVGMALFKKLVTISEKYLNITQFSIDSLIGDKLEYTLLDPYYSDLDGEYWWNVDDPNTNCLQKSSWNDVNIQEQSKFEPIVIKGGLSEK